jgi:hypothetical protein
MPKASEAPPPNVIPFAKPRALAALNHSGDPLGHLRPPLTMNGTATRTSNPIPGPVVPSMRPNVAPAPSMRAAAPMTPAATPANRPVSHGSLALAQPVTSWPQQQPY